ncbi:MAG TPA: hypothetical protein V6D05_04540 [Stenomitos sp.]
MQKLFAYLLPVVLASAFVAGTAEAKPRHHAKSHAMAVPRKATLKKVSHAPFHVVKHHKAHRRAK